MASSIGGSGGIGRGNLSYPSPFFDIAQTYSPVTMKEMFRWTRFYYMSNSTVAPVIFKLAEYPVTGLVYNKNPGEHESKMEDLLERNIGIKTLMIEMLLDYHTFGNSFASISFHFKRSLVCKSCSHSHPINKINYKFGDGKFKARCKKCRNSGDFDISDVYVKNRKKVNVVRWNPELIDINSNPVTGDTRYTYTLPKKVIKEIKAGNKFYIETMPKQFLEAARKGKKIVLDNANLYHLKRPNLADDDNSWGMPLLLPVLKDIFQLTILKKSNEAAALEHILPWRIIFPAANADMSPYIDHDLSNWRRKIEDQVRLWRRDPNHISVMPIPSSIESVGGDAKMLFTHQEEKMVQSTIAAGVGIPLEMLTSNMNWSGSSVTLRILENHFINAREKLDDFLNNFLIPKLTSHFEWKSMTVRQKDFKMADDVQQKQIIVGLAQAGKVSWTDTLADLGYDYDEQVEKIENEISDESNLLIKRMRAQAESQNMMNSVTQKGQMGLQNRIQREAAEFGGQGQQVGQPGTDATAQPGENAQPNAKPAPSGAAQQDTQQDTQQEVMVNSPEIINAFASQIAPLPASQRVAAIKQIGATNPETAKAVKAAITKMTKSAKSPAGGTPESKPSASASGVV